jgi:hypothetical protein
MRICNSLRLLFTHFYPWQVLQTFCTLLRADSMSAVFSLLPVRWVRRLVPSGLKRANGLDDKLTALIPVSAVWELHKLESSSASYFAPLIANLVSIVILPQKTCQYDGT